MVISENKELTLKDYFDTVRKHVAVIAGVVITFTALSAYHIIVSPKIYQVETRLVIERNMPQITKNVDDVYEQSSRDTDYFQTQVNILGARAIAQRVFEKADLAKDEEFMNCGQPVDQLLSMVKIKTVKISTMVVVSVTGRDAVKITEIANTWAREFTYFDMERKMGTTQYGVGWLEEQLSGTLKKLQEAEKALNVFIKTNKIVSNPDIEAQKQSLLEDLKSQRAGLEKQVGETGKRYGPKHPKMIALRSQEKTIDEQLAAETEKYLALQEVFVEYKVLKKNVDTFKVLYDELLMRAKELDVSKELSVSNIRIIDQAEVPKNPIKPQPKRDLFLGFVTSLFFGVAFAFVLDSLDATLKNADEVVAHTKFPFLGYVPLAKEVVKAGLQGYPITHLKPQSTIAESFRNLKVSLLFSSPKDRPLRSIMVTSALPGEGKSFVSLNLAIAFAQAGEPTVYIDADLRRGQAHDVFSMDNKEGLSSLLTGLCSLEDCLKSTPVPNLWLISTGPYVPNPAELLSSKQLEGVLSTLKNKFSHVIINSVPLLGIADARVTGQTTDGIIFVIKAGGTPVKVVMEAAQEAKNLKIIGAVLNQKRVESDRPYYYQYYGSEKKK